MKKFILSILAIAVTVVSCQNYDDEFASLNEKITNLETKIATLADLQAAVSSLQTNVSSLATAIASVGSDVEDLGAFSQDLAQILADISELQASLADASDAQIEAMQDELATLSGALSALISENGSNIAAVLDAVEENGGDLESIVSAIAEISTDLEGLLAAVLDSEDTVIAAVLEAILESETVVLEDIAALLLAENTNNAALASAIASVAAQLDVQDANALSNFNDLLAAVAAGFDGSSTELADALAEILSEMNIDNLDVLAALDQILDLQITHVGDILISNLAELEFAESLGTKIQILKGDLYVNLAASSTLDIARVNSVLSRIEAVVASIEDAGDNNSEGDYGSVEVYIATGEKVELANLRSISGYVGLTAAEGSIIEFAALREIAVGSGSNIIRTDLNGHLEITASEESSVLLPALEQVVNGGSVKVNTDGTIDGVAGKIDLSSLTSVAGNYTVMGNDVLDQNLVTVGTFDGENLVSGGSVHLAYEGGYTQPSLQNAGAIYVIDSATTTSVDFSGASNVNSLSTYTTSAENGTDIRYISLLETNATANTIDFAVATDIAIGEINVDVITAASAINLNHGFTGDLLSGIAITAPEATTVEINAATITGLTSITINEDAMLTVLAETLEDLILVGGANVDFSATSIEGNVVIDMSGSEVSSLDFSALTEINGVLNSDNFLAAATEIDFESLESIAIDMNIALATLLEFPSLTASEDIDAQDTVDFQAPLLYVELADQISLDEDAVFSAIGAEAASVFATSATIGQITLTEQADDFNTSGFIAMTVLTVNGADTTANRVSLNVAGDNIALETVTITGDWNQLAIGDSGVYAANDYSSIVTGANDLSSLTSLSTSGTVQAFTLQNAAVIENVTLNHTQNTTFGTSYAFINNPELVGFTTNASTVTSFEVVDNASLIGFDATSITNVPADAVNDGVGRLYNYLFVIHGNGLVGDYQINDNTNVETFTQSSILTIKDYILAINEAVLADVDLGISPSSLVIRIDYLLEDESVVEGMDDATPTADGYGDSDSFDGTTLDYATYTAIDTVTEVSSIN